MTPPATVENTGPPGTAALRSGDRPSSAVGVAPAVASTVAAICPVDRGSVTTCGSACPGAFTISGT